jgi:acetolactate synthase-1/2/3 large subunit
MPTCNRNVSGKPHNEMLLGDADTKGVIGAKGAVLV